MDYSLWLFALSVSFLFLERLWPRTPQSVLRRGIGSDLAYLIFNGEYLGVLAATAATQVIPWLDRSLDLIHLRQYFYLGAMSAASFPVQLVVLILAFDFVQWIVHNLMHRIPLLWRFHKVHHSIENMDWIGNWRFHWVEVVVYRTFLYPFGAFFGFSMEALFVYGLFSTLIGHFAHANMRLRIGPLKYLLNSPEMHVWHHTHPDSGPMDRNFGISLSLWDWLFGTAYLPTGEDPQRLGFAGIENYPGHLPGQLVAPFLPERTHGPDQAAGVPRLQCHHPQ